MSKSVNVDELSIKINNAKSRLTNAITSQSYPPNVQTKFETLQGDLEALSSAGDFANSDNVTAIINLLDDVEEYLSPQYMHPVSEELWGGVVPEDLAMTDIPYKVSCGKGGWNKCDQVFNIRGLSYLYDDVKVPSEAPLFHLCGVQLFKTPVLSPNIATAPWSALPNKQPFEEWLIINYMVPGVVPLQVVCYFTASKEVRDIIKGKGEVEGETQGWHNAVKRFWQADKAYCDAHFKLIPNVVEGPWAIRMAVGTKPALIGNKLQLHYSRGEGYFEVDIDIGSSNVASRILAMVRDVTSALVVDLAITLEGVSDDELPERILCQSRWSGINFKNAPQLSG